MSFRRFVNLVSSDALKSVYTLRRIDMSRFFLPTTTTTNGTTTKQQDSALPDPIINFYSPQGLRACGDMDFMLVDDDKVVAIATDGVGGAFIYDTSKQAVRSLPDAHARFKNSPTSLTVGGSDLYVIDGRTNRTGTRSFQALIYTGLTPDAGQAERNWHWRALPPPPPPPPCIQELDDRTSIDSCAAFADGSHIWMSAIGDVKSCTHLFDTQGLVWSKQWPADWVLPFTGGAQYVPELQKLWFGISSRDHGHAFCAADLSRPPVLRAVFDDDMAPAGVPEDRLISAHAVHLGSGRFCLARFFSVLKTPDGVSKVTHILGYDEEIFVVVAGVEVLTQGEELRLVKHHSERYMFFDHELHWVL